MSLGTILDSVKKRFQPIQPLQKLEKVEYESPKMDKDIPFAMMITMQGKRVMLYAGNLCPACHKPLADLFGTRRCNNRECHLAGLKQN